jgi:hypothetical protein
MISGSILRDTIDLPNINELRVSFNVQASYGNVVAEVDVDHHSKKVINDLATLNPLK